MSENISKPLSKFEIKEQKEKASQLRLEKEVIEELSHQAILAKPHFKYPFLNWINIPMFYVLTQLRFSLKGLFKASSIGSKKIDLTSLFEEGRPAFQAFEDERANFRSLNYYYADQYSGSYKLNYAMASIAVLFAVSSLLLLFLNEKIHSESLEGVIRTMGFCKLVILLLIVINTRQANDIDFNQRAISVRYVMEQLRAMAFLSIFGIENIPGIHEHSRFHKKTARKYLDDFVQKEIKNIYKKTKKHKLTDKEYAKKLDSIITFIRSEWINDQIIYQQNRYKSQKMLHVRLEWWAGLLNQIVLYFVLFDVTLIIFEPHIGMTEQQKEFISFNVTPYIFLLAAVFPAAVASFNGIKSQTEARKIAERAERMIESLEYMDDAFVKLQKMSPNLTIVRISKELDLLMKETARVMIMEVTEWTMIFARDVAEV